MIGGRETPEELDDRARAHEDDDFMISINEKERLTERQRITEC